jgi:site-specific DNA recombinase
MKAIILARVSSKEQEDGQSIPSQVRRLTEYSLKKNLQIERVFQITESSSKETRKQFDQVISLIKKSKEPVALVTDTVDRLQRSFRETPILDEIRKKGKLELHFLREGLVVNKDANSAQLLQWDIGVLFASSYIRQLSDNVKRSKEQSARNGEWTSKAPFGYKNVTLPSGSKTVEVDLLTSPFLVKMFELYATGLYSLKTLAVKMSELGMRSSNGNKIFASGIEFILKNPFYYGLMRVKNELYPHKYIPLISEWLFNKVQGVLQSRNKSPVQYAGKKILFRGLITCNNCGCLVSGDIKKKKYTYYSCNNSKRICKKRWVREEKLLAVVLGYFEKIQLSNDLVDETVKYLKKSISNEQEFFNSSQENLRKELDNIQNRISKLIDMHLDGVIDSETYKIKLEEYKKRQREITSNMRDQVDADETCLITAQRVLGLARRAKEIFISSKLSEKQQFLKFVFSNLKMDDGNLLVELREPFSTMAKMKDETKWLPEQDSNLRQND